MGRLSSAVVSVTLLLSCSPSLGAEAPAPPTHTYAIPCPPSELLRRHDALLALAAQVRADLGATQDADLSSGAAAIRQRNTTLFQIAVLERDTAAAHRALERVRSTFDAPAARAMSGLFTEPYLEARVSPGSDFHAAFRERLTGRLAALPYGDVQFTLAAVRGQMKAASPDTSVGTVRAALDPLVQDGRIAAGDAATLIALAVNDELVRFAREDLLACLDATIAAHRDDATPFSPRVGVVQPPLRGAWFGQQAPAHTPVRFAPAILDSLNPWCNGIAFSPDGKECFLSIGGATYGGMRIVHATCEAGVWTPFAPPAYLDGFISTGEPHFSPDGGTLYFTGKRAGEFGRLWALTRTGATWSKPERQPARIEGEGDAYRGRRTNDGTWYFGLQLQGMMQIYRTTPGGAAGVGIEKLGAPVNLQAYDGDPCVAPDGRWLVFNSARELAGRADLYVSFADGKGNWGTPVHLGPEYNTPDDEFGAMLSPDGRHLFFTRHTIAENQLYWVDTAAIDALEPAVRR
ncbi:MAG: PD40 domain-containing protein [Candidatus Eisenbacteria bacterium]|nr:PD40 domain-containing protein [Candidatus Eisenbacteria bacterium]